MAGPIVSTGSLRSPLSTGVEMAMRATQMGWPAHIPEGIEDRADVYRRLLAW